MPITFDHKAVGPLDEATIRHIVREAETGMADGVDPKAALVEAVQKHLAAGHASVIKQAIEGAAETADLTGLPVDFASLGLGDVLASLASHNDNLDAVAYAFALAQVQEKQVLPMHRAKFLSKVGIVKSHIDSIMPASAPPAPPTGSDMDDVVLRGLAAADVQMPDITDPEARDLMGLPPLPLPASAAPSAAAPAPSAATPVSSAATGAGKAPNMSDAMQAIGDALTMDNKAMAERLGVSPGTFANWLTGRVKRIALTLPQAQVLIADAELRVSKLRAAADELTAVR